MTRSMGFCNWRNGRGLCATLVALSLALVSSTGFAKGELQAAIDAAQAGATLLLDDGLYEGKLVIRKPLTLKAQGPNVVIRGDGTGDVILVQASHVTLEGLHVEGSGVQHQSVDAGIHVDGAQDVHILHNTFTDCLFGINFEKTHASSIVGNTITSKPFAPGLRGDGFRLWYSHNNLISHNTTNAVRDNVFWYSSGNTVEYNEGRGSRYSLHFMYANRNTVAHNHYDHNTVGVFLMFTQDVDVFDNVISHASGPFGVGIGMKESSNVTVRHNELLYNARGFYLDSSPYQPGTLNTFTDNRIFFNTTGFLLHGTLLPSHFEDNAFKGNIDDVNNDTPESHLEINQWRHNYWDNYQGFDRNRDGFGDIAHEQYLFADRLWSYLPPAKLFYGSPILDVMNFLWRLMPFSEPQRLLTDPEPRISAPQWSEP